jgi:hypothetical protein
MVEFRVRHGDHRRTPAHPAARPLLRSDEAAGDRHLPTIQPRRGAASCSDDQGAAAWLRDPIRLTGLVIALVVDRSLAGLTIVRWSLYVRNVLLAVDG